MDIQMVGVELPVETLHLFHDILHLLGIRKRNASVDINRQLALFVQLVQTLIDTLVECLTLRITCVEDNSHTGLYGIVDPTLQLSINLLVCDI